MLRKIYIFYNLYLKYKIYLKKKTYSQYKEDLFVIQFFKNKKKGFYVDVGCNHPSRINNTFLLYNLGWRGVNIDMSKFCIDLFNIARKEDQNFNFAVSNTNKLITYYTNKDLFLLASIMWNKESSKFKYKNKVQSKKLTDILDSSKFKQKQIDFLNIDAEGADFLVLKSLNFRIYKPKLICVEIYGEERKPTIKKNKIYKFLIKKNYKLLHETPDNCFFSLKNN